MPHRDQIDAPTNWDCVFLVVHSLWTDAIDGRPYDRRQKAHWASLLAELQQAAARAGYYDTPRRAPASHYSTRSSDT